MSLAEEVRGRSPATLVGTSCVEAASQRREGARFGDRRKAMLEDIALLTVARHHGRPGNQLENVKLRTWPRQEDHGGADIPPSSKAAGSRLKSKDV